MNGENIPAKKELMDFLGKLTGLSMGGNYKHIDDIFSTLLANLTEMFKADYSYISFLFENQAFKENRYQTSYRIPIDYCYNLNIITAKRSSTILDTNYQYVFSINDITDERTSTSAKELGIKSFLSVPILGTDASLASINLYYSQNITLSPQFIADVHTLSELMVLTFQAAYTKSRKQEEALSRKDYYLNAYEYILVLDNHYFIQDINNRMMNYIGKKLVNTELNFTSLLVNQTNIDTFYSVVKSIEFNEIVDVEIFTIKIEDFEELVLQCSIIKILSDYNEVRFIISGRPINDTETRSNTTQESYILPQIDEFKRMFTLNQEIAIDKFRSAFFPSAYAMAVNEESGPILISSSPNTDKNEIFQEIIKLMAGLNIDQLMKQMYITGTTPWSIPQGKLHWIAFTISNEEARGKIEIHLVGIVVKQFLINAIPALLQSLSGSLMGAMNDYISIINEDEADFVTTEYHGDRNFSTITLIHESLDYLRHITTMLLGTHTIT